MKMSALEIEYQKGFGEWLPRGCSRMSADSYCAPALPDVMTEENVKLLEDWEGSWSKLTTLTWIKVSRAGQVRKSDFPSKGIN